MFLRATPPHLSPARRSRPLRCGAPRCASPAAAGGDAAPASRPGRAHALATDERAAVSAAAPTHHPHPPLLPPRLLLCDVREALLAQEAGIVWSWLARAALGPRPALYAPGGAPCGTRSRLEWHLQQTEARDGATFVNSLALAARLTSRRSPFVCRRYTRLRAGTPTRTSTRSSRRCCRRVAHLPSPCSGLNLDPSFIPIFPCCGSKSPLPSPVPRSRPRSCPPAPRPRL